MYCSGVCAGLFEAPPLLLLLPHTSCSKQTAHRRMPREGACASAGSKREQPQPRPATCACRARRPALRGTPAAVAARCPVLAGAIPAACGPSSTTSPVLHCSTVHAAALHSQLFYSCCFVVDVWLQWQQAVRSTLGRWAPLSCWARCGAWCGTSSAACTAGSTSWPLTKHAPSTAAASRKATTTSYR